MLNLTLDFWQEHADKHKEFREYLEYTFTKQTVRSASGNTKHLVYKCALAELLDPEDKTNQETRALTLELLQVQCAAGLRKLHDERTVLPQYLASQDGALSFENQAQAHIDTEGCELSNDKFSESVFGTFDRSLRRNEGISREAASGLAQARQQYILLHYYKYN